MVPLGGGAGRGRAVVAGRGAPDAAGDCGAVIWKCWLATYALQTHGGLHSAGEEATAMRAWEMALSHAFLGFLSARAAIAFLRGDIPPHGAWTFGRHRERKATRA